MESDGQWLEDELNGQADRGDWQEMQASLLCEILVNYGEQGATFEDLVEDGIDEAEVDELLSQMVERGEIEEESDEDGESRYRLVAKPSRLSP